MNERDSEAVAAMLRGRGYRIVADENECDILLLNTCSVRDAAEQKAIGKAGYLQQRKKQLAEELVSEDDGFVKSLTEEEIQYLFS